MEYNSEKMIKHVIQDMDEGVMLIDGKGVIHLVNPAAESILAKPKEEMLEKKFAEVFLDDKDNDLFFQTVLDAIYDPEVKHENLIPYIIDDGRKVLHMVTSLTLGSEVDKGVIITFSDITEITELKIKHAEQVEGMLASMVHAFVTAVDARSSYNVHHTNNMVKMGDAFFTWLDKTGNSMRFDTNERDNILMSISLHDIGKLSVPLSIMDKPTRLAGNLEKIEARFTKVDLLRKIDMLEGKISEEAYENDCRFRKDLLELIEEMNKSGFCPPEKAEKIKSLGETEFMDENGASQPYLTADEIEMLSVMKGTLTDKERKIMQNHVVVTSDILAQIAFPDEYKMVPVWAGQHHELLNGSGYPKGLKADEICPEVRLITILDVFEAITSKDRPYKQEISPEKAFMIMDKMVEEGSIDGEILALFKQSEAWLL